MGISEGGEIGVVSSMKCKHISAVFEVFEGVTDPRVWFILFIMVRDQGNGTLFRKKASSSWSLS